MGTDKNPKLKKHYFLFKKKTVFFIVYTAVFTVQHSAFGGIAKKEYSSFTKSLYN